MITFSTACSGVEAASLAWEPIGFQPKWFSQYDPEHNYASGPDFPSAVLAERWPHIPNYGNMMNLRLFIELQEIEAPDVFCAGTPCQAYSIAGLRGGMADSRGALTLEYVRIANAIDETRTAAGEPAGIHVWENVPGVLSSKDNAFGYFLAGLAGEDDPLVPPGSKWPNSGCVFGPKRAIAWRILDAQYFGVAQRRRRVFLVASGRDGFDPVAVLLECEGVRRGSPPCREAQSGATSDPAHGSGGSCNTELATFRMVAFGEYSDDDTASTVKARDYKDATDLVAYGFQPRIGRNGRGDMGDVCHTLSAQAGGTAPCVVTSAGSCFNPEQPQCWRVYDIEGVSPALQSGEGRGNAILFPITGEVATTMTSGSNKPSAKGAVSGRFFSENPVVTQFGVRRLMPVECERLMGFPDYHVRIPWRGKPADQCPDGPMYKAIGNSKAVPVVQWLGLRIKREIECGDIGL